jgi:predicted acetylornithine/succinylornithine family transaminase
MSQLFANYNRLPVSFASGSGCSLTDTEGKHYLDFLSGIAVTSLGHSHPKLVEALTKQVSQLLHVSNLYRIPEQEKAAEKLVSLCGKGVLERVFFCNSGAEANECLLKMARKYAHEKGLPPVVTVATNGFHGRTLATVSATGTPKYHEGFAPLVPGFRFVDFNDLSQAVESLEESCAVLLEPVQGEGGVIPAEPDFLLGMEAACREQGKLLLLDEVQTGIGRAGEWLAAHHYGVQPDAVSLAKGLGAGIPVGAVLARTSLAELLQPGSHGTTFGGNPLACQAVCTVLDTILEEGLLEQARTLGTYLKERLWELEGVESVRGLGLMVAAVTTRPGREIAEEAFRRGLLINAVRPQVIRLAPPLIVSKQEIDCAMATLKPILCLT